MYSHDLGTSAMTYNYPETQRITQIVIYGAGANPIAVNIADIPADFIYDSTLDALYVENFELPMFLENGRLMEIIWN